MVYTAKTPKGPWQAQCSDTQHSADCLDPSGDFACVSDNSSANDVDGVIGGTPTPGQGCNYKGRMQRSAVRAQQNFVIKVVTGGEDLFIWTGDRWQQSPDGLKGHEGQTWSILDFDDAGRIRPIRWQDSISFNISTSDLVVL